ncbi:DUF2304 domain-containing protein [Trueperella sp. LYQ143]|uniref:DUF2304 domain-containing protein n=1 Tax=unclassified Trueperella TaxID=2630174 RepID=UPI003983CFAC
MLIKIILITVVLIVCIPLIRGTQTTRNVALRRLLLLVFVLLAVISIIYPQIMTSVAQFLGVGRGTDLLLYLLVIAFLSYSVVSFRRVNILENRIVDLSRELAIARTHPHTLTREGQFHVDPDPAHAVLHGAAPQGTLAVDVVTVEHDNSTNQVDMDADPVPTDYPEIPGHHLQNPETEKERS